MMTLTKIYLNAIAILLHLVLMTVFIIKLHFLLSMNQWSCLVCMPFQKALCSPGASKLQAQHLRDAVAGSTISATIESVCSLLYLPRQSSFVGQGSDLLSFMVVWSSFNCFAQRVFVPLLLMKFFVDCQAVLQSSLPLVTFTYMVKLGLEV